MAFQTLSGNTITGSNGSASSGFKTLSGQQLTKGGSTGFQTLSETNPAPVTPTPTQTAKAAPVAKPQQNDLFSNVEGIYNGIVGKVGSLLKPINPQAQQPAPKVINLPQGLKMKFTNPPAQTQQQSQQSAQMTTTPKSLQQQKQTVQTASKVNQGINDTHASMVKGVSGVFHGTLEQLQSAITDPVGNQQLDSYKKNFGKALTDTLKTIPTTIANSYKDVAQNQQDVAQSIQKNGPLSSKTIGEELQTISKDANFVFSPLTGLFAAADKVPGLTTVAKILTLPFTAAGEAGSTSVGKLVDLMPISKQAKDNLKPPLEELGSLAAQIWMGKISEITPGKKAELIDKYGEKDAVTIVNKAQELAKEKTVEPGKYSPQELRNQVMQKGIEDTPHGQEILKATLQADQAGKHIEIQPQSVHNFEQNIQDYRSYGGYTDGTSTENAALRDIQAAADNPEVKAHTQEQVKTAIQTKELPVNEDGTVTLYRGGKTSEKNGLSSASYDKEIAKQFVKDGEPVQEFKVKPEDIKAFIGKAEKEVLVEKGRVNPEEKPSAETKTLSLFRESRTPEINPKDSHFGDQSYFDKFSKGSYGKYKHKVELPNDSKILDFNQDTPLIHEIMDKVVKLVDKNADYKSFDEAWAFPHYVSKVIKEDGYDVAKWKGEYILPKETISKFRVKEKPPVAEAGLSDTKPEAGVKERTFDKTGKETQPSSQKKEQTGEPSSRLPVGEGKLRDSAARKRLVEHLETKSPEDLAKLNPSELKYHQMSIADQAEKALNYIEKTDPQEAYSVAKGYKNPPEGLLPHSVTMALADRALQEKNYSLWSELESSGSLALTREGQDIVMERGRYSENSPHAYIRQLMSQRLSKLGNMTESIKQGEEAVMKTLKSAKAKAIAKIDRETTKLQTELHKQQAKIQSAQSILDALTCK